MQTEMTPEKLLELKLQLTDWFTTSTHANRTHLDPFDSCPKNNQYIMSAEDRGRAVHNIKEMELAVPLPESQRLCKLQTSESVAFARFFAVRCFYFGVLTDD